MRYTPMELAESFLKTGELTDALDALNQQLLDAPTDQEARRLRAQLLTRLGQPQNALDDLQQLTDFSTDDVLLQVRLYEMLGQFDDALDVLQTTYNQRPEDGKLAENWWQLLTRQQRYEEAAQIAAVQLTDWRWQQLHGQSLASNGQISEAIAVYQQALASLEAKLPNFSDQRNAQAWQAQLMLLLVGCYVKQRDWQNAQTMLNQVRPLTEDSIVTFYTGMVAVGQGQIADGIKYIQTALQASSLEVRAALLHDLRDHEVLHLL